MGNELLVRAYHVGLGDCFYVRIPNGDDDFHMLIDCGSKGSIDLLRQAVTHMRDEMLPDGATAGKKRLDLIVVSHMHQDHIKGFEPDLFVDLEVKHIWLSAGMNENHPQAQKTRRLHSFAAAAMQEIEARGLALSPELQNLVALYGASNDVAMSTLQEDIPAANNITPLYVQAGMSSREHDLGLQEATITVLAPEADIDHFYLGEDVDSSLAALQKQGAEAAAENVGGAAETAVPANISILDFRQLQSRMLSNALAFAAQDSSIQNNTSAVLLIEWRGRRLLFVGDAEWEGEYREGKDNGSWNVMWHQRQEHLQKPLDFLKIGHHGSFNATPRRKDKDADYEVNQILDAILPLPAENETPAALALVSTQRANYKTIPDASLLVELGRRVSNGRHYAAAFTTRLDVNIEEDINAFFREQEAEWFDHPQPWRTDLENLLSGALFVDVNLTPAAISEGD
jgi:beta-lactamase superfamily II metal-dependent hydrolase